MLKRIIKLNFILTPTYCPKNLAEVQTSIFMDCLNTERWVSSFAGAMSLSFPQSRIITDTTLYS